MLPPSISSMVCPRRKTRLSPTRILESANRRPLLDREVTSSIGGLWCLFADGRRTLALPWRMRIFRLVGFSLVAGCASLSQQPGERLVWVNPDRARSFSADEQDCRAVAKQLHPAEADFLGINSKREFKVCLSSKYNWRQTTLAAARQSGALVGGFVD